MVQIQPTFERAHRVRKSPQRQLGGFQFFHSVSECRLDLNNPQLPLGGFPRLDTAFAVWRALLSGRVEFFLCFQDHRFDFRELVERQISNSAIADAG